MRQIFALILFATISMACAVCPAEARRGVITGIDYSGHAFNCHWESDDWTYQITDQTVFILDGAQVVSFSDLGVDATVDVDYHEDGGGYVADRVVIISLH